MKNKLTDLNNHLFAQLERLGDESLTAAGVQKEVERSKQITSVADTLIDSARVSLDAAALCAKHGRKNVPHSPMLEVHHDPVVPQIR